MENLFFLLVKGRRQCMVTGTESGLSLFRGAFRNPKSNKGGNMKKFSLAAAILLFLSFGEAFPQGAKEEVQKIHFVQDDSQDKMVSRIFILKYLQANDITPFVAGMVKRYNINSSVSCMVYGNNNQEILTVTCPVEMMPYVEDFLAKADRNVKIKGHTPGEIIKGTGITRAVYTPRYRSGQEMINIIVNALINEGPYSSLYGYDQNSNQIYWKDNTSNTEYVYDFLQYLDRPAPQLNFVFQVYEVRESVMRDMGIDYLAWKNGPGLNLFQVGFRAMDLSSSGSAALQSLSGPLGGFFFAPQFDMSFLRLLQQNGKADIRESASLTVSNSETRTYTLSFNPQFQRIYKGENDITQVGSITGLPEGYSQMLLQITSPIVNLHYGIPQTPYPESEAFALPSYKKGFYNTLGGTLQFSYSLQTAHIVEQNNLGDELMDLSTMNGSVTIPLRKETILAKWDLMQKVEQTIGIPFLCDIPYLKYLFSTTTTSTEKVSFYVTVRVTPSLVTVPEKFHAGLLKKIK